MNNWKNYIIVILSLIILLLLGFIFYQNKCVPPSVDILRITDTVVVHNTDTLYKEKIKFVTKYDTIISYDVTINDSIHQITDTLEIPIEHKQAQFSITKDSLTINTNVFYQGFRAQIDSIETSYDFNYTIQPPKQKKIGLVWCVGPYVGYGFQFNKGQYTNGIEVGIGASIGIGGIIK